MRSSRAGFIVQIDDPRLAMNYMLNPAMTIEQQRAWRSSASKRSNHALRGLPEDRVRHRTATASVTRACAAKR